MTPAEVQFYLMLMVNVLIASSVAHPNQYWSALGFRPPWWVRQALPFWMTILLTFIGVGLTIKIIGPAALLAGAAVLALMMYGAWTNDDDDRDA